MPTRRPSDRLRAGASRDPAFATHRPAPDDPTPTAVVPLRTDRGRRAVAAVRPAARKSLRPTVPTFAPARSDAFRIPPCVAGTVAVRAPARRLAPPAFFVRRAGFATPTTVTAGQIPSGGALRRIARVPPEARKFPGPIARTAAPTRSAALRNHALAHRSADVAAPALPGGPRGVPAPREPTVVRSRSPAAPPRPFPGDCQSPRSDGHGPQRAVPLRCEAAPAAFASPRSRAAIVRPRAARTRPIATFARCAKGPTCRAVRRHLRTWPHVGLTEPRRGRVGPAFPRGR